MTQNVFRKAAEIRASPSTSTAPRPHRTVPPSKNPGAGPTAAGQPSSVNKRQRRRAVTHAVLICSVLGLLAAAPVLATSTLLRNGLKPVLAALADTPDVPAPTRPELAAGTVSGLHLDAEWIRATAAATDIPERALSAYAAATLTIQHEFPNCNLGWNMLAAIGEVETRHGTIYGATLGDDGVAVPAITGPALDGRWRIQKYPRHG